MKKIVTSRYIFNGQCLVENKAVLIDENIIKQIINKDQIDDPKLVQDYGNSIITPGFIDLQLNVCGGVLFNDQISIDTLEIMYQTCLKFGTTSFLPTLITCDFKDVIKALEVVKTWFDLYENHRGVLGIHLEGPFISRDKSGIHAKELIIKPTQELLEKIVSYRAYFPIQMTIAVEEFSISQIRFLADNQVILSVGHSNANYQQTKAAIDNGVMAATHVFNAMSGLTGRKPDVIGAVLNNEIYASVIVDKYHVDPANVELLHKLKPSHTYLVTDAVTPMGTNIKQFKLCGKVIHIRQGKCIDESGVLGGAYLTMNDAVANCVNFCNISLEHALNMASYIPAKVMSLEHSLGKVAEGFRANLVALDLNDYSCRII